MSLKTAAELMKELNDAFNEFKQSEGAERQRLASEVVALRRQLRDVETAQARIVPGPGGFNPSSGEGRPEAREAFSAFLRGRDPNGEGMAVYAGAMTTSIGPDGGFAVPQEIANDIEKLERSLSPMRRIARIRTVSSDRPEQLVNKGGVSSGWVGELDSRGDTESDDLAVVTPTMGEIFAQPVLTQRQLDDAMYNSEQFITESVAEEFAVQEGTAFATGNGVQKPRGILSAPNAELADSARPFGTLEFKKSGAAGAFVAAPNGGDCLVDLVHALRAPYRQGAVWTMNSKTFATVRKLKDSNGAFLWRPGVEAGAPDVLLGYPVFEWEDMPDIAANSLSIAFGNFQRGYVICDHRVGVRMLRDSVTTKGRVKFYTTKRVGGGVVNSQAIKLLKFAA